MFEAPCNISLPDFSANRLNREVSCHWFSGSGNLVLETEAVFEIQIYSEKMDKVMVKLFLLPVFDAQVCPVVLGDVDLVGLDVVQQLLLLGEVALKEEIVEHWHGDLVQLDNLEIILV